MTLEMPDVPEKKPLSKKEKQAIAHKKWRQSEKGKAWIAKHRQSDKYKADQQRRYQERKKPVLEPIK